MNNYAIYYSYKGIGDVIIVTFDNTKKATRSERKGKVEVIYHDDEIIGYNIFDVKDIIKIKSEGMIFLPSPAFIEVVNSILINSGVKPLEINEHSGYYTARITDKKEIENDKYLYTLSIGDEELHSIIKDGSLNINDVVVIAKVGVHLYNGQIVKENNLDEIKINCHICINKELGIDVNEDATLVLDDSEIGKDFFSLEAK